MCSMRSIGRLKNITNTGAIDVQFGTDFPKYGFVNFLSGVFFFSELVPHVFKWVQIRKPRHMWKEHFLATGSTIILVLSTCVFVLEKFGCST